MSLWDEILNHPDLKARPPVLVDIGAAGGVHSAWRKLAPYAVGVGFEPDRREAAPLAGAQKLFKRWVFVPAIAAAETPSNGALSFHLTRSPQCSSALKPDTRGLSEWAFARLFDVCEETELPAVSLHESLRATGIDYVDALKCDTQGMDLRLFLSGPEEWRRRMLSVEMEPGIIDAYCGEDHLSDVLESMRAEPFWLAQCDVQSTPRGRPELLRSQLGELVGERYAFFGPGAPGWANVKYLRDLRKDVGALDRRAFLLGWCLANDHPAVALGIASDGWERFGDPVFGRMIEQSRRKAQRCVSSGRLRSLFRRFLPRE